MKPKTCLTVGGSDSCGGAGIQADLRVLQSLRVSACSATSALTAQNPTTINHIQASSEAQFKAELNTIADYYDITHIKTGMLFDDIHLDILLNIKQTKLKSAIMIVDPVLIASSGKQLFQSDKPKQAYARLLSAADCWTPNLQEAEFLLGQAITDNSAACLQLKHKYDIPVLLKGGHNDNTTLTDIFCDAQGSLTNYRHPKLNLKPSQAHGTGCRLGSALTAYLALGYDLEQAVEKAHFWLQSELTEA